MPYECFRELIEHHVAAIFTQSRKTRLQVQLLIICPIACTLVVGPPGDSTRGKYQNLTEAQGKNTRMIAFVGRLELDMLFWGHHVLLAERPGADGHLFSSGLQLLHWW